jgi:hypothetical protein
MKLSILLQKIGEDKIRLQRLDEALVSAKTKKDGLTTHITFVTQQAQAMDYHRGMTPKMHGIVLWLPREDMDRVLKEAAEAKSNG